MTGRPRYRPIYFMAVSGVHLLGLAYTRFCDVCVNQAGMVSRPSWGCALVASLYFHIQRYSGIIKGKYIEPC